MQSDEWRSTIIAPGEQFVMITGTLMMLVLSADNLFFVLPRMSMGLLVMARELGPFSCRRSGMENHKCDQSTDASVRYGNTGGGNN